MLNVEMKLRDDLWDAKEKVATRDGFGHGVLEAGRADERIVVLSADLVESTRGEWFAKEFPKRYIEVGVAEQNLATVAAGMANYGKIPFITSYAAFSPGRNWEQISTTTALNDLPVIVCGMHAGVSVGPDGATHQMLEDITLMRVIPNMIVLSPCDAEEGRKATIAAAKAGKPVYIRFARDKTPVMTTPETLFEIGKLNVLWRCDEPKVVIFATGPLVHGALLAARELEQEGIGAIVANVHTIKPLDRAAVLELAHRARAVVTVEEHQIIGGLGGAIAETLSVSLPTPMAMVGVRDRFGQSGETPQLMAEYGMDVPHIKEAAKTVLARRA